MISHPGYFGKIGMRYFHKTLNKNYLPTINVSNLWSLVSEEVSRPVYEFRILLCPELSVIT